MSGIPNRSFTAYAIINPFGGFWCQETFDSPLEAFEFFKKHKGNLDLSDFSYVPCTVTIEVEHVIAQTKPVPFKSAQFQ